MAADASTVSAYRIALNGQPTAIEGTSGATPFVAALWRWWRASWATGYFYLRLAFPEKIGSLLLL